jgi:isoquinoline 1-oxidoreductase
MSTEYLTQSLADIDYDEPVDRVEFDFTFDCGLTRRQFVQLLGAGLLIAVASNSAEAQERPRGGRGGGGGGGGGGGRGGNPPNRPVSARIHLAPDGTITVLTGKVECGQGSRAEITQAAAEELRVSPDVIRLVMADTAIVPDDGITAGSRTTPSTIPAIRQAAAAARTLLVELAASKWNVDRAAVEIRDGKFVHASSQKSLGYADVAATDAKALDKTVPPDVKLTSLAEWKTLGTSVARPNARDIVTGAHQYPSDVRRPGMLYAKVLRPVGYGAKLNSIDATAAKGTKDVTVVQDGGFVAVAAPTTFAADRALDALAAAAKWDAAPHLASKDLYDHLRKTARGGVPANPYADEVAKAAKKLKQTYHVAYVQHSPMEPRTAVAEWSADGQGLTVWTATQNPFRVRGEIAGAMKIPEDRVRVVVPDFGGGFGGKHSGECAVEAARIARAAGKPVSLRWTRQEEFTWAYFRPAAVIDAEASLDDAGKLTSWYFINLNSGGSAIESPYRAGKARTQFIQSDAPLRHGSYRGLAATANTFARECFMDELAALAGQDPLAFRLANLENERLRAVLESAAKHFDWTTRAKQKQQPNVGVGLACGTEKGSYVAACAEIAIDPQTSAISVRHVCQAYECGAILNPAGLRSQVEGAIIMGLGPALREEIRFENGKVTTDEFSAYKVPRVADVPPRLDVHLLNRPDLQPIGAGETPIIAIAPAIANAVHHATGQRVRQMPIRLQNAAAAAG